MKILLVASVVSIAAYGAQMLPATTHWVQTLDSRPEAVLTGGALLIAASLLRRRVAAIRTR